MRTGGMGPGSGNHWSDQFRSRGGNFMLGNRSSFDRMYGTGAWNVAYTVWNNSSMTWIDTRSRNGIWVDERITEEPKLEYNKTTGIYSFTGDVVVINRFIPFSGRVEGGDPQGQGGSNPFTLLDAAGGLLTLEDGYNNFFHNHTTYTTTKGITKNIYKANGAVRSARAAKFATTSKIVKGAGVAGTALMTGVALTNIVNDLNNGNAVSGKDVADFSVGAVGLGTTALVTLGIVSNPVGWVIGGGVAVYSLGSLAYDLYTTDW